MSSAYTTRLALKAGMSYEEALQLPFRLCASLIAAEERKEIMRLADKDGNIYIGDIIERGRRERPFL
jgi:hypothetical protein